jgi:methionine--tRNA ligase beta chain
MPEVSFEEFQKLDICIGKIISVEDIPGSKNLIKLNVDFGSEKRQAVAGLKQHAKPEDLTGKKYVFVLNLEKRKIMGIESQCMILAAEDSKGSIVLLQPEKDIETGSKIR